MTIIKLKHPMLFKSHSLAVIPTRLMVRFEGLVYKQWKRIKEKNVRFRVENCLFNVGFCFIQNSFSKNYNASFYVIPFSVINSLYICCRSLYKCINNIWINQISIIVCVINVCIVSKVLAFYFFFCSDSSILFFFLKFFIQVEQSIYIIVYLMMWFIVYGDGMNDALSKGWKLFFSFCSIRNDFQQQQKTFFGHKCFHEIGS